MRKLHVKQHCSARIFVSIECLNVLGPKRDDVVGQRILQNEEICNLYSSTNVSRLTKPRRIRWVGAVSRQGEKKSA
jgi:hypothetical protein